MGQIKQENIPSGNKVSELKLEEVELKNVLVRGGTKEKIKVKILPFDRYNDEHVEFAYAYSDMLYRAPSEFKTVSDAARAYVRLFVAHTQEDGKNEDSDFSKVHNDLRACRTLFNQDNIMLALNDFFENA